MQDTPIRCLEIWNPTWPRGPCVDNQKCEHRNWALPISFWHQQDIRKYLAQQRSKPKLKRIKLGMPCPNRRPGRFPCTVGLPRRLDPRKPPRPVWLESGLFPNQFWIYFWSGKLGDYVSDMFPTEIWPSPPYKRVGTHHVEESNFQSSKNTSTTLLP